MIVVHCQQYTNACFILCAFLCVVSVPVRCNKYKCARVQNCNDKVAIAAISLNKIRDFKLSAFLRMLVVSSIF